MPIQGTAADGLKLALYFLRKLVNLPASARVLATVHDEIIIELLLTQ